MVCSWVTRANERATTTTIYHAALPRHRATHTRALAHARTQAPRRRLNLSAWSLVVVLAGSIASPRAPDPFRSLCFVFRPLSLARDPTSTRPFLVRFCTPHTPGRYFRGLATSNSPTNHQTIAVVHLGSENDAACTEPRIKACGSKFTNQAIC